MLIKTLQMENFRQFRGNTSIDFSCDLDRNVTVILGDNTFGKTTLLQAFYWCFYGEVVFSHRRDFLLNYELAQLMNKGDVNKVKVEVVVVHNGTEYVITRTQQYFCNDEGGIDGDGTDIKISYKQDDGQSKTVREGQERNVILNILPENLASYFFFDTERISSISSRKDVADAVKGLMGIEYISQAISHLGERAKSKSVIGKLYASMDQNGDAKARDALNSINEAESQREIIAESITNCESDINRYEGRKEQLEAILRSNDSTAKIQKEKEQLEQLINTEKRVLEDTIAQYLKEFSSASLLFFAQPLLREVSTFLKDAKVDDKGVIDLTGPTITELIKRGRCICGQAIQEGNEAYKHLIEELSFVPPEHIGSAVRNYRENIEIFSQTFEHTYSSLEVHYKNILRTKNRIQDWEDQVQEKCEQISGKEDMRKYEQELSDIRLRLRELQSKKDRLHRDDGAQKNEIERNKKIYDSLTAVSDKNHEAMKLIAYAESIRDWFEEKRKEKESTIREELETKVNEIFEKMYHGNCRVAIDSKYNAELLTVVSDREISTGESEGSNRVKNFAFIAGLVSLAREKLLSQRNDSNVDLSSEPYPLVMDAPFSNTDETHTRNISCVLPDAAEQIIMFVMHKDWYYAKPVLSRRIGKQYNLIKDSETCTRLVEIGS